MDRRTADRLVGGSLAVLLAGGGYLTWDATQRAQSAPDGMGGMMDGQTMHGPDPLVYAVATLVFAGLVLGVYLLVREATTSSHAPGDAAPPAPQSRVPGDGAAGGARVATGGSATADAESATESQQSGTETAGHPDDGDSPQQPGDDDARDEQSPVADRQLLSMLPEDERRILEPVVDSPGITQIALRDRADFSKSKVSQTVSELEKRGLLYRERQGRTYRIYPSDDLEQS
jgi:DNA-binding transcriptional ArsR family regulator